MAKKSSYNCILYEIGDKVVEKYGSNEVLEIEAVDLKHVGIFPTQFLKFKDKPINVGAFSNLYIPAAETIEKYKDGLKYFAEVTVKRQDTQTQKGNRVHSILAKQLRKKEKEEIDLTDETIFKTRVIPAGMFKTKPKENGTENK
jgi:hypothetical protein